MIPQDKQVTVRPTSNQNVREYHFDEKISEVGYAEFWLPLYGSDSEFNKLGAKGKKLATKLMTSGNKQSSMESSKEPIERITFRPHSVRVYKAPTASWAIVEEQVVIPAIQSSIDSNLQPVQYGTQKQRDLERERELAGASR